MLLPQPLHTAENGYRLPASALGFSFVSDLEALLLNSHLGI